MIDMRTLVFSLSVALCACSTPYQDMGLMGGVKATQIDATTLRIVGKGNAYTGAETIQNYVFLKAAEETQRLGYDMFLVLDEQNSKKIGVITTPGSATSYTTGSATAYGTGNFANAYGSSTTRTYYTPGSVIPYEKPRTNIMIKLFKGIKPENAPPNLFVASEIIQYLGPQMRGK